ncbi:hypothetical protein J437_LFUL012439 [Ladona fulva]|uniref:Reverse transcriptase n=1 Tax=Ladona fulva TaxID=123851 RepID=A0A8K0KBN0_LADFU|nr:hypothetical protein J437_LFUL012439 [Ladona fulva]
MYGFYVHRVCVDKSPAILAKLLKRRLAAAYLQRATYRHLEWYSKWRLGVNAKKTQAILFTMKTTADDPDPIIVEAEEVPWSSTAIYLGVTLDRRLSLKQHAKANASKARSRGRLIRPLLRSPLLKLQTKTQLYQMTILSMLLYASSAWSGFITRNLWDIIGKTDRTILRTILGDTPQPKDYFRRPIASQGGVLSLPPRGRKKWK